MDKTNPNSTDTKRSFLGRIEFDGKYESQWLKEANAARRRFIIILIVISALIAATVLFMINKAYAADPNEYEIIFEWEYDKTVPGLKGYRLFQEGKLLVEVPDKNTMTINKKTILAERTCFTMTAYGDDPEQESKHSEAYCVKLPLPVSWLNHILTGKNLSRG